MTQGSFDTDAPQKPAPGRNMPEFSVSELSGALKRTVEEAFGGVRVRGEVSGFKRAASGHLYMALKDEHAVLDAVCWRGVAQKLRHRPEEGLEVIATGRLTTYPGRSKYQLVIESIEPAGEGALLKLLEERRRLLAGEGLFDESRKQPLPFLPEVIGIITSPTGAVIRDMLHRLRERFPRRVLLWPVPVQGSGAAEQVAKAVRGFNGRLPAGKLPKPDVLIVARGGGSLEDLWCFNEEIVVRAVAGSAIPVISAVGHETDTTLMDHAADLRAPTPTGAAEKAVPVRADLLARLTELTRPLSHPGRLLEDKRQKLDIWSERLPGALSRQIAAAALVLTKTAARLMSPRDLVRERTGQLTGLGRSLEIQVGQRLRLCAAELGGLTARLQPTRLSAEIRHGATRLDQLSGRLTAAMDRRLTVEQGRLQLSARLLESTSHKAVLKRGFALVRDDAGLPIRTAADLKPGREVTLELADGRRAARIEEGASAPKTERRKPRKRTKNPADDRQGSLMGELFQDGTRTLPI